MSNYINYFGLRNNVVLFKAQNKMSAIDIQPLLHSYRKSEKRNEHIFSGRLAISITSGGAYEKAYIRKGEAKALFGSIINGTFTKNFGANGHQVYGGSQKDGKIESRILKFHIYNGKFQISISSGPGKKSPQGAIQPIGGKSAVNVFTTLSTTQALEMAHEVLDYIRAAESFAVSVDIPLNTLNRVQEDPPVEKSVRTTGQNLNKTYSGQSNRPNSNNQQHQELDLTSLSNDEFKVYFRTIKEKYIEATKEVERRTYLHNQNKTQGNAG